MIVNFQINKVECRKYPNISFSSLSINHDMTLKNPHIIRTKTPFGDKIILRIDYHLSVNYLNPSLGFMVFEGTSDYFIDGDLTIIINNWQENNDDVNKIKNEVSSVVFMNIIPFAMMISKHLNLPSVVPLPQVNFGEKVEKKEEHQSYIG